MAEMPEGVSKSCTDLVQDLQNLGCNDQQKLILAVQVYRDLIHEVKVKKLENMYDKAMDLIYFRAEHTTSEVELVIPCPNDTSVDMLTFEKIRRKISGGIKCVTMAVADMDSTVVYYSVINDFKENDSHYVKFARRTTETTQ